MNLHRFYESRLSKSEDPKTFVTRIRGLLRGGMPDVPVELRERMLMEHLTRALPSDWQLKLPVSDARTVEAYIRRMERIGAANSFEGDSNGTCEKCSASQVSHELRRLQGVCFKCGKRGHVAADCSDPDRQVSQGRIRYSVSRVVKLANGHLAARCPQRQRTEKSRIPRVQFGDDAPS